MSRSCLRTVLMSFLGLVGCGGEDLLPPLAEQSSESVNALSLQQKIDDALGVISRHKDICTQNPSSTICQSRPYAYNPAQFNMAPSSGEAILIVDEFPKLPLRAIRYKNRIKAYLRAQPGGDISPVQFSWNTPPALYTSLGMFAEPDLIPAESLRPLSAPLYESFGYLNYENIGHGSTVFSLLIEANPRQPIVVMDRPTLPGIALTEFCDATGASHPALFDKSEHAASELVRIMQEHNVRFVNVSFGETFETIRGKWQSTCQGSLPSNEVLREKLAAYAPIVEALTSTPGVFAAQAAINALNLQDFPYDFPSAAYPNRVLTGYFTSLNSGLDAQGRGNTSSLVGWPQRQNVDLYLNSGVLPQRPFPYNETPLLQVDGFGVDIYPVTATTTSWITPLALSRFIHLRNANFASDEMDDQLISTIRSQMVPTSCGEPAAPCVFQDPLLHGQIEAVRLNYRSSEYQEP